MGGGKVLVVRRVLQVLGVAFLPEQRVLAIAKERAEAEGWPWREPVLLQHRLMRTLVTTNADMRGGNVRVLIDARSGDVVRAGFVAY